MPIPYIIIRKEADLSLPMSISNKLDTNEDRNMKVEIQIPNLYG